MCAFELAALSWSFEAPSASSAAPLPLLLHPLPSPSSMETPQRYWSGLYWDGIDPEQIGQRRSRSREGGQRRRPRTRVDSSPRLYVLCSGAVDLSDASCDDDPTLNAMLLQARQHVAESGQDVAEFAVSIIDMREAAGDAATADASDEQADTPTSAAAAPSAAASPAAAAAAALSAAASPSSPSSVGSVCSGRCVVVRLWHEAVFQGARESARGDPGALCRDLHFDPLNALYLHQTSLAQTDQMLDNAAEEAMAQENKAVALESAPGE